ncbi:MAG: radical SAM protein [Ignavibacteriae bacterium]|nr:MAG: radical SAM protein [Ignavibacteriota bacterium]
MATLIVKATEACNSNCYYCDVVTKEQRGGTMSLELLELLFKRMNEYLLHYPEERIELIWHGGEPLLLGHEFYRQAKLFQRLHCAETEGRISHTIQSNLTCFTEKFISVFRDLGIDCIGTSYDPEPHMRGPGKERDSETYNRKFLSSISILEKNGLHWGIIYVVTKRSLERPEDVFHFLTNLKLSGGVNFNPVLIYDDLRKDVAITPEEYADFLGAIFPLWWKHRTRYPDIQPFKSFVENIIEHKTSLSCGESGNCSHHHINIAPNGDASHCGRSADWGLLQYGNITERTFDEILHDPQRDQLDERVSLLINSECRACRFWELCHGGCPLDAWSKHKEFIHKTEWCNARIRFVEKHFEPVTGVKYEPQPVPSHPEPACEK